MALDDDQPLTGAQFQRAVGADPEKWAEAFVQRAAAISEHLSDGLRDELVGWFRDAMEAAVKAAAAVTLEADFFTRERAERTRAEWSEKPSD